MNATNCRIAQLQHMLDKNLISKKYNVDWIFGEKGNIDCQVIHTDYLHLYSKYLIGCSALHFAATERTLEAFHILLDRRAAITTRNNQNSTALHEIIEKNETLISKNYKLDDTFVHLVLSAHLKNSNFENPSNESGLSHFHVACAANSAELVKGFLYSGVIIDHAVKAVSSRVPGYTALHFATRYCAFEVVEVLLSHGATICIKDAKGMTPLMLALESRLKMIDEEDLDEALRDRNEKILKLVLERESNDDKMIIDNWGLSHLHMACTLKDSKIAESLLQKVVNINHAVNIESPLCPGYTPLHLAALFNVDIVKLLMKNGADISKKNSQGITPLEICAEKYGADDTCVILSLSSLYKHTVPSNGKNKVINSAYASEDPNKISSFLRSLSKNFSTGNSPLWLGCSALHLAVLFSEKKVKSRNRDHKELDLEVLKKLWKSLKTLHTQDVHGRSPLHLAFRLDKKPILDLLLERIESRAKLTDLVDEDGLSYLHIASAENRTNLLAKLLATGTNINAVYNGKSLVSPAVYSGSTALHFAVMSKSIEAVKELMKHGADVYAKDANDMTPIHLLLHPDLQNEYPSDALLDTPNLRDSIVRGIGLSHLHVACLRENLPAVRRLLDSGADVNATTITHSNEIPSQFSFLKKYAGHSPLLLAEEKDDGDLAELLLERGADAFVKDTDGTPLIYSVLEIMSLCTFAVFVDYLRQNREVQMLVVAEIGMTRLHVACLTAEIDLVEQLIDEGVDVNARIRDDSPMLTGYTPLHVVLHVSYEYNGEIIGRMIELLVKAGVDVTLQDAKYGSTAVHMACRIFFFNNFDGNFHEDRPIPADSLEYVHVKTLLKTQRDFSVNPVNFEGISHFHVACYVCDASIVDKFLSHADVDVNRTIDFFHHRVPGYTALHLAAANSIECRIVSEQLATIDLLLENGADARARNAFGNTPLHEAALLSSLDVFERLVRSGADVEARNHCGNTALSHFIESGKVSAEKIRVLLRCGCQFNTFNALTDEGCVGATVHKLPYADMQNLLSAVAINFKQNMAMDNSGRTPIHNIVSVDSPSISALEYAELIEKLYRMDCDVDKQDYLGRTALHAAVKFHNSKGISGLLMVGADVNITDGKNQSVLDYYVGHCELCSPENFGRRINEVCSHLVTLETLLIHVKKLQLCGLDVNEENEEFVCKAPENFANAWTEEFIKELETVKITTIGSYSLTLYDFLSESGAVIDYTTMSEMKRNDISEYLSSRGTQTRREKFPEIAGILQLQYRKARARPQLLELAKNTMEILIGFRMPEICSHFILVPLKNSDLKNLVASVTD